ncbi:MAG: hypothetical protein A3F41_03770 [Coxiella sp. RIFCSPHIGHO2_12_FULL_44_14]|nr:MAG: hypothetical protein A3F41_03770 [Coxiella sp. RIFCSPHIGHO2_12_FULL_44_14]
MLHSNESQLPLLSHKNSTNHSGYALIYIWKSNLLIQYHAKRKVGHIAVQLYDANNDPVVDGHISAWPAQAPGKKIKFLSNLAETIRYEGDEYPDETFKIDQLNINEIRKDFHRKRTQVKWALYGSGFCRNTNRTINCVGLVLELFKETFYAYENKNIISITGCETEKISEVVHNIKAGYNTSQGWGRLISCFCSTIILASMFISGLYSLYVSIFSLIVVIFRFSGKELPDNFPAKNEWESSMWKETGSSLVLFIITTIFFVIFMLGGCYRLIDVLSVCCHITSRFIGVFPNDVSLVLNYFVAKGVANVSKEDGNDLTYSAEDDFDDDSAVSHALLLKERKSFP